MAPNLFGRRDEVSITPEVIDQALSWMVRLQSGAVDETTQLECEQWRKRNAMHELAWQRVSGLGQDMRIAGEVVAAPMARVVLRNAAGNTRRVVLKSLAGLGILGGGVFLANESRVWSGIGADFQTATGEQRWLKLADGTRVLLNTATAVDVNYGAEIRSVRLLHGEVLIETAADLQGRPFELVAMQGRVRPVGTRFTVRQSGSEPTSVAVLEGAVDIFPSQGSSLRLHAGEQAQFVSSGVDEPQMLEAGQGAWRDGMLVVERMRLADFIAELGRYRSGYLRCDPAVADLRVSGAFPLRDPDAVLSLLAETLPIQIVTRTRYWLTVVPANV